MKQLNRRVYAIVGVIVLLFAGLVYAWSVLSTPIAAEFTGWTKAQLSLTFTLVMILFCIGSLLCGLLAGKLSAKNAVRLGAVLFLAGFYIASRCQAPLTLYLGFGVLCGLGSGLSYNAVMSTMVKWFPDKPGLISGVLLMGFGGGSFLIGKLSFTEQALDENFKAVADEIKRLKPSTVKGRYVTKATITSTMNPGVPVDPTVIA